MRICQQSFYASQQKCFAGRFHAPNALVLRPIQRAQVKTITSARFPVSRHLSPAKRVPEKQNRKKSSFRVSQKHPPFPNLCHTRIVTATTMQGPKGTGARAARPRASARPMTSTNVHGLKGTTGLPPTPRLRRTRRTTRLLDLCSVAAFRENAADLMRRPVFPTNPIVHGKHRASLAPILRIIPISPIGFIGPISATNTPKLPNEPKHKPPNPNGINLSGPAAASPAPKRTQITAFTHHASRITQGKGHGENTP